MFVKAAGVSSSGQTLGTDCTVRLYSTIALTLLPGLPHAG